jgi:hypothetical protein
MNGSIHNSHKIQTYSTVTYHVLLIPPPANAPAAKHPAFADQQQYQSGGNGITFSSFFKKVRRSWRKAKRAFGGSDNVGVGGFLNGASAGEESDGDQRKAI